MSGGIETESLEELGEDLSQIGDGLVKYNESSDEMRVRPIKKLIGGDNELIVVTEFSSVVGVAINDICRIAIGRAESCIGVLMFDSLGSYDNLTLVIKSDPDRPRHVFTAYSVGLGLPAELATNISKQLYEDDTEIDYTNIANNILDTIPEGEDKYRGNKKVNRIAGQVSNFDKVSSVSEVLDIINVESKSEDQENDNGFSAFRS